MGVVGAVPVSVAENKSANKREFEQKVGSSNLASAWTLDTVRFVNKLTVSVVGGGAGGRLSLEAATDSEWYDLVALTDLRPEVGSELRSKFPGLQFFSDFREMFRICPTDMVC